MILEPPSGDGSGLAAGASDGSGACVGPQPSSVGEAGSVVADLGEQASTGECPDARETGDDFRVWVLSECGFGVRGELFGVVSCGVEQSQ